MNELNLILVDDEGNQWVEMKLTRQGDTRWSAKLGIITGEGLSMYQRALHRAPGMNPFALVISIVSQLPEEAFRGSFDNPGSPSMARRLTRTMREIQARLR